MAELYEDAMKPGRQQYEPAARGCLASLNGIVTELKGEIDGARGEYERKLVEAGKEYVGVMVNYQDNVLTKTGKVMADLHD